MDKKSIYEFVNFKQYLNSYIEFEGKNQGRGIHKRIAEYIGISPSYLSQLLSQKKQLNSDQGYLFCEFAGLSLNESRYFLKMIEKEKASNIRLKQVIEAELTEMRQQFAQIKSIVKNEITDLSVEQKSQFYSSWKYSLVRLACALERKNTLDGITKATGIPVKHVKPILDFLLKTGLCNVRDGKYFLTQKHIHIESGSPEVNNHHGNWRRKAMDAHPQLDQARELSYTLVCGLSEIDAIALREYLREQIKILNQKITVSPMEVGYCLNIDWFQVLEPS